MAPSTSFITLVHRHSVALHYTKHFGFWYVDRFLQKERSWSKIISQFRKHTHEWLEGNINGTLCKLL